MVEKLRIIILGGRKIVYQGEVRQAVLPGLDGEFSVLDFHQPFLYRLRKGIVKVKIADYTDENKEELFPVKNGLAKFTENSLLILCEME